MTRPPSRADHNLARRLRAMGLDLSPDRIQRFREVGLLLAPEPDYPGGGGSSGRYPREAIERVREAIELADRHPRALYIAVLGMFGRGNFPVEEEKLRHHFVHLFDRFEQEIREAAEAGSEAGPRDLGARPRTASGGFVS